MGFDGFPPGFENTTWGMRQTERCEVLGSEIQNGTSEPC